MNKPRRNRLGLLAGAALMVCSIHVAAASAASVPADLRVVTDTGRQLADVRQYTDTTAVPTSPSAKCFFNGVGGSGKPKTIFGPTALGAVNDAAANVPALSPLSVTDEYSFGLGVCGFGGVSSGPGNFWEVRIDHKSLQVGGDQAQVSPGDDVLWALVPPPVCDPNPPYTCGPPLPELTLDAPARVKPGAPFEVTVSQYDPKGFLNAAVGAFVTGASVPTDAAGHTTVTLPVTTTLAASRTGSVSSRNIDVCVNVKLKRCAPVRGLVIFGSEAADGIDGTLGNDTIKAAGGDDDISARGRGRDSIQCGAGIDRVRADRTDTVDKASCEKVKRFGKKRKKKTQSGNKGGSKK